MKRYTPISSAHYTTAPPTTWLVHGVLPSSGLATIYGPSGSGKSFLLLDLAASLAEGGSWFDRKTKLSKVLLLPLEGKGGLRQRIRAWELHSQRPFPENVKFIAEDFALNSEGDVTDLIKAVKDAGSFDVIVIDTLNRAAPNADENSSAAMSQLVGAASKLEKAISGLVLLVHHTGKDESRGLRGHSSLHAALDTAIEVKRNGESRGWRLAKSKDSEDGISKAFQLVTIKIEDEGYEPTSSCIIQPTITKDFIMNTEKHLTPNQQFVRNHVDAMFVASEEVMEVLTGEYLPMVKYEQILDSVKGTMTGERKHQRSRAKEALDWLIKHDYFSLTDDDWVSSGNPEVHVSPTSNFIMNGLVELSDQ
jgi:putative DNA primase/helicase